MHMFDGSIAVDDIWSLYIFCPQVLIYFDIFSVVYVCFCLCMHPANDDTIPNFNFPAKFAASTRSTNARYPWEYAIYEIDPVN